MTNTPAGYYDDGSGNQRWWDGEKWADPAPAAPAAPTASAAPMVQVVTASAPRAAVAPNYVVLQVVLKEKLIGTGSGNLTELEKAINAQASRGYRLHTITTASSGSKGLGGGDRIQATIVFEQIL